MRSVKSGDGNPEPRSANARGSRFSEPPRFFVSRTRNADRDCTIQSFQVVVALDQAVRLFILPPKMAPNVDASWQLSRRILRPDRKSANARTGAANRPFVQPARHRWVGPAGWSPDLR